MQKVLFWGGLVGLIATAAYLDARGVTALVEAAMAVDGKALAQPPQIYVVTRGDERPSAAPLLAHDPFDSSAKPSRDPPPEEPADPRDAARCEGLAVRVIAFADDPEWSLASLWDTRESRSVVRRRGDDVRGQSVAFIGRDRVWLSHGRALCQVEMYAPPPATAPATSASAESRASASPGVTRAPDPAIAKNIKRQGDRDYAIDRAYLDRMLDDPSELMKLAQTVPVKVDGKMVGIQLKGVRPDSALGALGLVDGDRLEKVNGYDLAAPEKILEAYARLREAPHLTVQITRGGKVMNFDYAIR